MKPKLKQTTTIIQLTIFIFCLCFQQINGTPLANVRQYSVFKYQCPDKCVCVPDTQDLDLLVIACKWPLLQPQIFRSFPHNVTKSLQIQCTSSATKQKSSLGSGTFKDFAELRKLEISDCSLDALPSDTFQGLTSLHTLYLNGINEPQLDARIFTATPQLENLSLSRSRLKNVPRGVLCPLKRLQILNLSNNQLSDIRLGVQEDDCQLEHLIVLDVSWNRIRHVGSGDLKPFLNLRQLSAMGNQMDDIDTNAFQSTIQIQNLYLESNLLRTAPSLPDSLLQLNMADNRLEQLPATIANLENLVSLNLSRNEIDTQTPFSLFTTHLEALDLGHNKFDRIPLRLFEKSVDILKQLWMSGNRLVELEPEFFLNFTNLQTLDLSDNRLKSLDEGYFDGLSELNELRLSNNSVYHVAVEAFRPLGRQLQLLDMSGNQLAELPIAIGRLSRAKHLDFSRNKISKTYKFNLNKITHLNRLDLSNNQLEAVESYVFADCPHLSDLNLRNNKLKELASDSFHKCPQLRSLDLSQNQLETLDGSLKDSRSLRHLNLTQNQLKMLEYGELPEDLVSLSAAWNQIALLGAAGASRLRRLELQHNQISLLLGDQLPHTLEHLNISDNRLQQISEGTFVAMKQLRSVDARSNQLQVVSAQSFASSSHSTSNVIRLYLSSNPLQCSCHTEWMLNSTLRAGSPLQLYDFDRIRCRSTLRTSQHDAVDSDEMETSSDFLPLSQTTSQDFVCEYKGEMCPPNCPCCQYSTCDCKSSCPKGCKCFHDAGYQLNVVQCEAGENGVSRSKEPFNVASLPMYATHIRLRNILLPVLHKNVLVGRDHLVELEVNNTGLRHIEASALVQAQALKTLSLVNNQLHRLNGDEFVKARNVRSLFLSNNRFNTLEARVLSDTFPHLEELHLDGNSFVDLPKVIEEWPHEKLRQVALGTNPFRCDCLSQPDRYHVQDWIRLHADMVIDLKQVVCVENVTKALKTNDTAIFSDQLPNEGSDLFVMPMQEFLQQANRSYCTPREMGLFSSDPLWNNLLIIVLCIFMAILLFITVWTGVSVVRKSRHSPKHPRYRKATNSSSLLNGGNSLIGGGGISPHPPIQYDVFLSYSQSDYETVHEHLCVPLQNQYLTLMLLHQENFGDNQYSENSLQFVSDEMIRRMRSCNTLVWYLTQNFIRNEWRSLDIVTAHKLFVQDRQHKIIMVIGLDVDPNELDSDLGQILRRYATMIWMNNPLWRNLLMSHIPHRAYDHSGDGTLGIGDLKDNDSETTQIYSDMYGIITPSEIV